MDMKQILDYTESIIKHVKEEISDLCLAPDEEKEIACEVIAQLIDEYDAGDLFS